MVFRSFYKVLVISLFTAKCMAQPDLSCSWDSSFGTINWEEGWYGNESKTLEGSLSIIDGKYVYRGFWGRKNSKEYGKVMFTFSNDWNSFRGTYTRGQGSVENVWNGTANCGVFNPGADCEWTSTYGEINWEEGWYGNSTKTITGDFYLSEGREVFSGTWGRTNSNRKGRVMFYFKPDRKSFEGYYTNSLEIGTGTRQYAWSGKLECK